MNLQTKSTYERVVDLLNQASLMSKDVDKVSNLKIVEELIINKEPSLLDNFLEEMLAFQTDRSVEVKKYIIHFMAVAGKTDAELLPKIVSSMMMMMSEENVNIVKILVLNMSHVFKSVLKWIATTRSVTENMTKTWTQAFFMIGAVSEFIDSENEGLRSNAIKFLEIVVLALSKPPEDLELIRPSNNKGPAYQDDVNLSLVPHGHQTLKVDRLEIEGKKSFEKLLDYQSSIHISSINLITAMSSMTTIAKLRPTFLDQVLQGFESLHVNLPPTLTKSQVSSVRKQLKMQLLAILRLPAAIDYQQNIAILLTDLGASQSEIMKNMPRTDSTRKRKADDNSINLKKAKMELANTYDEENSMDYEEASPLPSVPTKTQMPSGTSLTGSTGKVSSVTPSLGDTQLSEETSKHQSAVDVTADDLIHRLTPHNVANLVLTSMTVLPDQMPPSFQSTYTPIAAAGTPVQIRHLARLLAAQLTNARLGKGYEMEEAQRRSYKEEPEGIAEVSRQVEEQQVIETVLCGSVVASNEPLEIEPEEEEVVPVASVVQPVRKRVVQFNVEQALEPMSKEEVTSHVRYLSERLLESPDVGSVSDSKRILNMKICSSSKDIKNEYLLRVFSDLKNYWSMAMSLIFDEYLNYKAASRRASVLPSSRKEQQKLLQKYEECVTVILVEILNRPELMDENVLHDFIFELPLLTVSIINVLKDCCLDEVHAYTSMVTLKELILKRPLLKEDCLNLLLSFSTHEKSEVRLNALKMIKNLYEGSDLEQTIEDHAMVLLKRLLNPTPPPELRNEADDTSDASWSDEPIRMCLYLYLALLPVRHKLIHELASVYTSSSSEIKRVILRVIETPVKGMGMDSPELLLLVENCPKGAETLVTRVIHILTDKVVPSPELVNKVRDLYQRRVSDVRFLIPVLNGLTKNEVIAALPKLIKLNPVVVKEVFNRLLGVNGQECRPSSLSPTELLVTLHTLDPAKADMKAIIKACNLCFVEKSVYTQDVLAGVMQQLMEINPLPTLLMRTVIQSLATYPKLTGFVLNILQRLITKQVWRNKRVWEGFVRCCQRTKPQSFQVLLQLPPTQLKDAFTLCPDLREPLLNHVIALTPHQRAHIPKAIMSVLEKPPAGNPQGLPDQPKLKLSEGDDKGALQTLRRGLKVFHQSNIPAPYENSPRSSHLKDDAEGFDGGLASEEEEQGGMANP